MEIREGPRVSLNVEHKPVQRKQRHQYVEIFPEFEVGPVDLGHGVSSLVMFEVSGVWKPVVPLVILKVLDFLEFFRV